MIIKAQLRVVNPAEQGVSLSTGNEWKRQSVVLGWTEERADGYPTQQLLQATLFGESVDLFEHCGYKPGDVIEADIRFSTKMGNNGRVYNDVTARLYN